MSRICSSISNILTRVVFVIIASVPRVSYLKLNCSPRMTILLLVALSSVVTPASCTVLASTGYLASNPTIRNILIRTGMSEEIKKQSNILYDSSGFRFTGDQGTGIRQALMNSHDIVEVKFRKRLLEEAQRVHSKDLKPLGVQHQDRVYSERLFSVLNQMDRKTCIAKLLCEIGADQKSYGIIGKKIDHFLRSVPPVTWNSATFPYIDSFQSGRRSGGGACARYGTCSYDLRKVVQFVWLFSHPLKI